MGYGVEDEKEGIVGLVKKEGEKVLGFVISEGREKWYEGVMVVRSNGVDRV